MDNLLRLSNSNIYKKYPNAILTRRVQENMPLVSLVNRGGDLIQIRRNTDFILSSKTRLPAIASEEEINQTEEHKFLDMYPLFPTIDLKEENIYDLNKPFILGHDGQLNNHVQTIFHINEDNFSNESDLSRLIMFAFGTAYAQSQLLKNSQVINLKFKESFKKVF